jgi:hypothetical protein
MKDLIICKKSDFEFDNGFKNKNLKKICKNEDIYLENVNEEEKMINVGGESYRFVRY